MGVFELLLVLVTLNDCHCQSSDWLRRLGVLYQSSDWLGRLSPERCVKWNVEPSVLMFWFTLLTGVDHGDSVMFR